MEKASVGENVRLRIDAKVLPVMNIVPVFDTYSKDLRRPST